MEKVNKDDLFTSIKSSLVLPDRTSRKITGKLTYMVFYLFFSVIVLTIFSFYAEYTFLRNAFSMITKEPAIAFNVYRSAIVILAVIFVLVLEPHILNRVLYALMPVTV